jgi:hypothetical protein
MNFTNDKVAKAFKSDAAYDFNLDVRIKNKEGVTESTWSGKLSEITPDAAKSLAIEMPELIQEIKANPKSIADKTEKAEK